MNSREGPPSPGASAAGDFPPRPDPQEQSLKTGRIRIERKAFVFALRENPRGRFLRITEAVPGRRETIIIPGPGLRDFKRVLDDMVKAASEIPRAREAKGAEPEKARGT